MTMIEKVARALARNQLSDLGKEAFDKDGCYYTNCFSKEHRDEFEAQAKVMIEAMREPTNDMANEYFKIRKSVGDNDKTAVFYVSVWQSMIDAALKG